MKIDLSKRIEWIKARTELDEYTISLIEFQMKEIVIEVASELKKLRVTDVSGRSELLPNSCECDNVETFNGWGNEKCIRCIDCGRVW
jgi:hypothetical protein